MVPEPDAKSMTRLPGAGAAYSNMMGGHTMGKNLVRVGEPDGS